HTHVVILHPAGQLYHYLPAPHQAYSLTVNGLAVPMAVEKGYARIERQWKSGDTIQFNLPMPVRRVLANEKVADDRGMVALERGPIVFCMERADNPNGVFDLLVPDNAKLQFAYRTDVLGGIGEITGEAVALARGADRVSLVRRQQNFTAIPYYAFGNRGQGEMAVWLARDESKALVPPKPTIASTSRASSSVGNGTVAENYPGHRPPTIEQRLYTNSQDGSGDISTISRNPPKSHPLRFTGRTTSSTAYCRQLGVCCTGTEAIGRRFRPRTPTPWQKTSSTK